ncbi:MAG: Nif3-like dinuclear metal center hexameric protein [Thermogutta sp.]|nr:Nif3-like dinuclear metal center hexameric protein [Thermogutta sp.]
MLTVGQVVDFLESFAPSRLAEDWDNVGLLVGSLERRVRKIMTCLTLTERTAGEAVEREAGLVIAHHPLPFRPQRRWTTDTPAGKVLWDLAATRVCVYSPHTAFDSASRGINQLLAEKIGLQDIRPLVPDAETPELGVGRQGTLPAELSLLECAQLVKNVLGIKYARAAGSPQMPIQRLAVGCGAADDLLDAAAAAGCQAFLVGEARFHTCLDAEFRGIGMLMVGHYASERFAVEHLASVLQEQFPQVEVWPADTEDDPIRWM